VGKGLDIESQSISQGRGEHSTIVSWAGRCKTSRKGRITAVVIFNIVANDAMRELSGEAKGGVYRPSRRSGSPDR